MEKVAPKVKLKKEPLQEVQEENSIDRVVEKPIQPSFSFPQRRSGFERRKTLMRHDSFDSEGRISTSGETLDKSDTSSEMGAKKKVFKEKENRRRSRKERGKIEEILGDDETKKSERLENEETRKKEPEETGRRSREERKSLREQECIERVNEFLTKHSILTYSESPAGFVDDTEEAVEATREIFVFDENKEQRDKRPSVLSDMQETSSSHPAEASSILYTKEEESTKELEVEKKVTEPIVPSAPESEIDVIVKTLDEFTESTNVEKPTEHLKPIEKVPEIEMSTVAKRPSSLRKRKDTFSRESSRESLLDETKKEVRIQENVEEIFFEDPSDQITGILPEVRLVKARIITAEEAVANRLEEPITKIEIHSPPEVAMVPEPMRVRATRIPSPETVDVSQLQLPGLAKSTSENALVDPDGKREDENRVSERNIKPEILLDLSKFSDAGEETEESVDGEKDGMERKLSRTGSEGSKRMQMRAKERRVFKIGSLAQPDEPQLTILLENVANERKSSVDGGRKRSLSEGIDTAKIERSDESSRETRSSPDQRRVVVDEVIVPSERIPRREEEEVQEERREEKGEVSEKEEQREEQERKSEEPDYERILRQQKRPLLEETVPSRLEDSLICKEHSLEYQSQTLESQADRLLHRALSSSLEDLLRSATDGWSRRIYEDQVERSFKETQYSPKERCDVETQTEQETKSTQCSPDQVASSPSESPRDSDSFYVVRRLYRSSKREVQTQTQGESKSVQCSLDDFGDLLPSIEPEQSYESPSKSERYVQESKSVQCIPEDISTSPGKSSDVQRSPCKDGLARSPRREVEVQTYQESKAVQCSDDELLEAEYTGTGYQASFQSRPTSSVSQKTESSPTSSSGSPCKFPTVVFVEERSDMTVTHRDHDGNVTWAKHWGSERLVEIYREPKTSLGLSIVGGKVDLHNGSSSKSQNISGIFIKNVLPNSPAGRTGELKIGDRIIEVDGVDLRHSTHERAVQVIQAAGNPVCLLVQSLVHLSEHESNAQGEEGGRGQNARNRLPVLGGAPGTPTASFHQNSSPVSPARSITPEVIQGGIEDGDRQSSSRSDFRRQSTRASDGAGPSARRSSMKKSIRKKAPSPPSNPGVLRQVSEEKEDHASPKPEAPPRRKYSSDESSEEEDTRELEGNVYTKAGMEISRKSAGNVKRTKEEIEADPEQEDEFGYTNMKVQKKYRNMGHKVLMIKVEKDRHGLGISLAGHKDRNRMAVFICGLNPRGAAYKGGELAIGDEILEVNGCVLQGRCHLNASAIIKGIAGPLFRIVVVRRAAAVDNIAVKPIFQFPPTLDDWNQFNQYKGVRNVAVKKGQYGLGIMIIEGKHAEVGQGIFISDIQEGSAAEQAGLQVGDLILAVNMDCLLGSTYDEATSLLKKAEGVVSLTVCNPNQSKVAKEEEDRAKGILPEPEKPVVKEPEKPKEPEPPQDPKDCKIQVGKDTTIEFQKEKDKGIGFTISGGSDTPMNGVFIIEVFPDGAAGKDGRLQSGDQILDMCNQSFKAIEHDKAHAAVLKASGAIVMVVHRHEKPAEEVDVELQKKSGKGAGLCLTGFKSGKGAYVSDLLPGGSALESGKICKGDRVVAVGGQDVREAPVEDIAVHVKVSNPVQLKLARYKSAKQ